MNKFFNLLIGLTMVVMGVVMLPFLLLMLLCKLCIVEEEVEPSITTNQIGEA